MNNLTEKQLRNGMTSIRADMFAQVWVGPLNASMAACDITTPARQAAFLSQVLFESEEFQHLHELLGYSAERLVEVWPHHFPTLAAALPYSHQPEKLANSVYANRLGNGNEASGDGWAYRGRGLIQLTGRDNYHRFSLATGVDATGQPDLLQQPAGAAMSAAWFWKANKLNDIADAITGPGHEASFEQLTKRVNGALKGTAAAQAILGEGMGGAQ